MILRVISGTAKGHKLSTYKGKDIRPTSDKVRGALFNIIGPEVVGSYFLDLFAGSGAVGIEALSRGAAKSLFVDKDIQSQRCIIRNLNKTRLENKGEVILGDVLKILLTLGQRDQLFDYIFLDPPYNTTTILTVLDLLKECKVLRKEGIIIVEHSCDNSEWAGNSDVVLVKKRCYGDTVLAFLK